MKPVNLGPFLGVNTRREASELHVDKTGDYLRAAVNVDLKNGKLRARPGIEQILAGAACHSLYGDGLEPAAYADGASLYRLRPGPDGGLDRELLRADLIPGMLLSYGRIGPALYWSNGLQRGWLDVADADDGWGPEADRTDPTKASYTWLPMPAGSIVRSLFGRLLVARGDRLYWSLPWNPAMREGGRSYIAPNPGEDVKMVAPVEDGGCFVATASRTFWIPGDVANAAGQTMVLPYGAVPRTDVQAPDGSVYWRSQRGLVRGTRSGEVENIQEPAVTVGPAASGATLVREYDGMRKVVSSASNASESRMAARSYMDAEIVRKGEA